MAVYAFIAEVLPDSCGTVYQMGRQMTSKPGSVGIAKCFKDGICAHALISHPLTIYLETKFSHHANDTNRRQKTLHLTFSSMDLILRNVF